MAAAVSSPFKSLGFDSLRALKSVVSASKTTEEQRLVHLVVRESAAGKDIGQFSLVLARQAGKVEALDVLLGSILDAERTA